MICWKDEIWAEAGVIGQSAASANGNSLFMDFPFFLFGGVLQFANVNPCH